jgi:hypothetical protein
MPEKKPFDPAKLDTLIIILIAIASLVTALVAWRTNVISSSAANTARQGLIDAVKKSAAEGENWRKAYQEAGYARDYLLENAAVSALEASNDPANKIYAQNLRTYLLPNMAMLAQPMGTSPNYLQADGTLDTQKRYEELNKQDPDLAALNPPASFEQAGLHYSHQRWLTVGAVMLAVSLFWLALAEINAGSMRVISLLIGTGLFLLSVGYFFIVEVAFFFLRGGLA